MPKRINRALPPVAQRLREWRNHLGITQIQIAEKVGINIGMLRKYESGLNIPGGNVLAAMAAMGLNINWLLSGEGAMDSHLAPEDSSSLTDDSDLARRLSVISSLLGDMEDGKRATVLNEIFSRVQEAKRVADLEDAVSAMTRKVA